MRGILDRIRRIVDVKFSGSLDEFAYAINYDYGKLNRILDGMEKPDVQLLYNVCFICNEVSTEYILLGTGQFYSKGVVNYTTAQIYQSMSKLCRCASVLQFLNEFEIEEIQNITQHINEVVLEDSKLTEWCSRAAIQ